jgi:uncharacterized protein YuzE
MKITYDKSVDAAYIHLGNFYSGKVVTTDSFEIKKIVPFGDINVDFDNDQKIVGIEVLNASKYLAEDLLNDAE